ncbi:MAG: ABC transporter permease [Bdellovibrionales bacterium]|nr:ABC transporter permease [Bdellovibrionales bacterium]
MRRPGRGIFAILERNLRAFRQDWIGTFCWLGAEPLLLLIAVGYGVGTLVGEVQGRAYLQFFFPALVVGAAMLNAYFEASQMSASKLFERKVYKAALATPLPPADIVVGEIFWSTIKAFMSSAFLLFAGLSAGILDPLPALQLAGFAFATALIFSSLGLLVGTWTLSAHGLLAIQSGIILPLFLFSGAFFPVTQVSENLARVLEFSPLTLSVRIARAIMYGELSMEIGFLALILGLQGFIFFNLSVNRALRNLFR